MMKGDYMNKDTFQNIFSEIINDILPKYLGKSINTLMQGVENEILEISDNYILILSARSPSKKPRKVYFADFEKIWKKEIHGKTLAELGRINHGRVIQAIFCLHPKIAYDFTSQTIYLR